MNADTERRLLALERQLGELQTRPRNWDLISPFLALSQLRFFYPLSSADQNAWPYDISGAGRQLTNNNGSVPTVYNSVVPYYDFNGTTQYLSRADEAGLDFSSVSMTVGGWFWADTLATANFLAAKDDVAAARVFNLAFRTTNSIARFEVSGDGSATVTVDSANNAIATSAWYFVIGRYTLNSAIDLYVNNVKTTNTTSIPAALYSAGAAAFTIGSQSGGGRYLDGRGTSIFGCADALTDAVISSLFAKTRGAFGV